MNRTRVFLPGGIALLFLLNTSSVPAQTHSFSDQLPFSGTSDRIAEMILGLSGKNLSSSSGHRLYSERSVPIQPGYLPRGAENPKSALAPNYPRYSDEVPSLSSFRYRVDESAHLCTTEVKFLKNSTTLSDECSKHYLYNLALALKHPSLARARFVVEGHASAEGPSSTNQILSQMRANAIFDFLVSQGVHPSRLLAVGQGESQARYPSSASEHLRASDRRVMVFKLAP